MGVGVDVDVGVDVGVDVDVDIGVDGGDTVAFTFCACVSVGNGPRSCLLVHPNRTRHRTVTNRKK